jgi:acyl-CoA synthetase (AMP-forming)/AMP-acid ligase II
MRGYWGEPELTAEALTGDGWLASSDLGHRDHQGNLVLAGRMGDMYIRGGYNVHPLQVEQVLSEHPAVAQAAVIGAPDPVLGEIGVAFVVPSPDAPAPTLAELRDWCKDRLADYKRPDRLVLVGALPLTSMMKVDKAALAGQL